MLSRRSQQYTMNSKTQMQQRQQAPSPPPNAGFARQRVVAAAAAVPARGIRGNPVRNEEFSFWSPPFAAAAAVATTTSSSTTSSSGNSQQRANAAARVTKGANYQRMNEQLVLVEQPSSSSSHHPLAPRQPRPRMGLSRPMMTSTPSVPAAKGISSPKRAQKRSNDDDEEPIYCEISKCGDSPLKSPTQQQQQQHRRAVQKRNVTTQRKVFTDYAPIPVAASAVTSAPGPLGRRAVTQLDMHRETLLQVKKQQQQQLVASRPDISSISGPQHHEFTRHPLALPPRNQLHQHQHHSQQQQQQQRAFHGDYCSEYGFSSGLDETTSTAATESLAATGSCVASSNGTTVRKGLLWQQRDKIFSRWKERFFILTQDYLQCFKRGTSRITEMGGFIFKLRLSEVECVELVDKKGYLTICLTLGKDSNKVLLRKPEGIRDWFQSLKECVDRSKERRGLMKTTKEFWSKKQFTDSSSMEQWIQARNRIEMKYAYSETESCASANATSNRPSRFGREISKSNLNVALRNPVTTTTTDYGFIDMPFADLKTDLHYGLEEDRTSVSPPISSELFRQKKIARDTSSTFSQDSGMDSMNTNSSGSVLSRQTPTGVTVASPYFESSVFRQQQQQHQPRSSKIPTLARRCRSPPPPPQQHPNSGSNNNNNNATIDEALRSISLV